MESHLTDTYTLETLPKLPARGFYTEEARERRLEFLKAETGATVPQTPLSCIDPETLKKNIENFIGTIEIPVGVAGPLLFKGDQAKGLIYAPLATTEGALVATITKGAQALSRSSGVRTRVLAHRMVRVPVFDFIHIDDALGFIKWIDENIESIRIETSRYSSYAKLQTVTSSIMGRSVFVEFEYTTGDASGQNMTTTCTWHAILWIKSQVGNRFNLQNMMIESTASSDKRASAYSMLKGRGIRVIAEAEIEESVVRSVLGTTSDRIVRAYQRCNLGSIRAGVVGTNINVANAIAAIFTATGQDIACTHESSVSQLYLEKTESGFYVSLLLPSLVIATIGGGTHLPHQRGYLEMLGCYGSGKVRRLAEIICGFALSLDICTLSALESGRFAIAHEKLGRNKPVNWFGAADFSDQFFKTALQQSLESESEFVSVEPKAQKLGSSIIAELTSRKVNKLVGHYTFLAKIKTESGLKELDLIAKVKPLDTEVMMMMTILASACQSELGQIYPKFTEQTGMKACDIKELAIYAQTDPRFTTFIPKIYTLYREDSREARVVLMEYVKSVRLKDTADDTSLWASQDIALVLDGLSQLHAIWYKKETELKAKPWIGFVRTKASFEAMVPLFEALDKNAKLEHAWYTEKDSQLRQSLIKSLPQWGAEFDALPKTLIHHDFNPRNICIRVESSGAERLCTYDWELATIHLPQYDLIEFLIFVLQPDTVTQEQVTHWIDFYRQKLSQTVGEPIDEISWRTGVQLCLNDFILCRLGLYLMAHAQRDYGFMQRIHTMSSRLYELINH